MRIPREAVPRNAARGKAHEPITDRTVHTDRLEAHISAMLTRVRSSGLKLTPQRMAIIRELAADPTHPTAQELFERLRPTLPTMSFATVYNTLDALASAGLCTALSLAPGPSRFDANMKPHHHAVCELCGLVRDVPRHPSNEPAPAPPSLLAGVEGFELRAVEHIYRGLCATCARENGRRSEDGRDGGNADEGFGAFGP